MACYWVVCEQQLSVITGLYKTWRLPEGTSGLWLGSEGKKLFPFPQMEWGWLGLEASVLKWVEGTYQCVVVGKGRGTAIRASVSLPRKQLVQRCLKGSDSVHKIPTLSKCSRKAAVHIGFPGFSAADILSCCVSRHIASRESGCLLLSVQPVGSCFFSAILPHPSVLFPPTLSICKCMTASPLCNGLIRRENSYCSAWMLVRSQANSSIILCLAYPLKSAKIDNERWELLGKILEGLLKDTCHEHLLEILFQILNSYIALKPYSAI